MLSLPAPALRRPPPPQPTGLLDDLPLDRPLILRLPPAGDTTAVLAELAQRGPTLVVVPSLRRAAVLAGRFRRAGGGVALLPDDWAQARAGAAVVLGARGAAWAPCPGLAGVAIVDGHDESLVQEQAPTWNAVTVAAERARRAGVPCVVVTPCPTLELLAAGRLRQVARQAERQGWAPLEVVDRRQDDPRLGLYSERLVALIREERRVVCVLNRTGRARLLVCAACGEVARCEQCGNAVAQQGASLVCPRCGVGRPPVCARCGSSRLRALRIGVSRAREELEALAGRPVGEVTGTTTQTQLPDSDVLVGTEAVLHRLNGTEQVDAIAFVDFDQELLAARVRAGEESLALLAHAARLVRGRAGRLLVQTRLPDHPALRAALLADPGLLADEEEPLRHLLRVPPVTAMAVVSGPSASGYVDALRDTSLDILGPDGDHWLLKAVDTAALVGALAAVPRPSGRLRVEVSPARF